MNGTDLHCSAQWLTMQDTELGVVCSNFQPFQARSIFIPPSPVPNLLHTNRAPSPWETLLIKDALSKLQSDLLQIDCEIYHIQSVQAQLLQKRDELREFGRVHNALLSSLRRFPHELLSYTFLLSVSDIDDTNAQELRKAVMLPAQVCRQWRNVALSTPRLWSQIHIDLKKRNLKEEAEFAQTWLVRSGGCPLSISLSQFMAVDVHKPLTPFETIFAHSDRWERLSLTVTHPLLHAFRSAKSHFPHLQTLSIQSITRDEEILDAFEIAPQLHSLTIGHNIFPTRLRVPWSQLTYCNMHPYQLSIDDCFEVLQHAFGLKKLLLHLHRPGPHQSRSLIRHEHLQELSIQANTELGPLFDKSSLPALQAFTCSSEFHYKWAQPQFLSFLSRSACPLQILCLDFLTSPVGDDDLAQILQLIPSLVKLELRHACARSTLTKPLFNKLTFVAQELEYLLPNLTTLVLDIYSKLDLEALADMIESRRRLENDASHRFPPLERVILTELENCASEWIESSTVLRLRRCRDRGLDIYWSRREGCQLLRLPL